MGRAIFYAGGRIAVLRGLFLILIVLVSLIIFCDKDCDKDYDKAGKIMELPLILETLI